jgi:hypothetical protein
MRSTDALANRYIGLVLPRINYNCCSQLKNPSIGSRFSRNLSECRIDQSHFLAYNFTILRKKIEGVLWVRALIFKQSGKRLMLWDMFLMMNLGVLSRQKVILRPAITNFRFNFNYNIPVLLSCSHAGYSQNRFHSAPYYPAPSE